MAKRPRKKVKRRQGKSHLEEHFAFLCKVNRLPEPERELRCIPGRRFRFDFAWPAHKLLVEIHGGTYSGGRHVTGRGIASDCEKLSLAVAEGYRVMAFTSDHVKKRPTWAIEQVRRALQASHPAPHPAEPPAPTR